LKIDHVTIAGSNLRLLENEFAKFDLTTEYGGPHSNGITHMSILGFEDGTYIELISTCEPNAVSPWWHNHIANNGGPCAWSIEVDSVQKEAKRLINRGIEVDGPTHYQRFRPDGTLVEWDLAIIGNYGMGAVLPFIIKDRTPRNYRVPKSPSVLGTELMGVATVIIGVDNFEQSSETFLRCYDIPPPVISKSSTLEANVAIFPNQPFVLASPISSGSWLAKRIRKFGESPCAYLIGSNNLDNSKQRFATGDSETWCGREVIWMKMDANELRLGFVEL